MVGTEYRIITVSGEKVNEIWEGKALSVQLSPHEESNGNAIVFVVGHRYGQPKPHNCITVGVSKIPAELIMEKNHTLWIGENSKLLSKDILCKIKPQKEVIIW